MCVLVAGRVEEKQLTLKVRSDVSKAAWVGAEHIRTSSFTETNHMLHRANVCVCIGFSDR